MPDVPKAVLSEQFQARLSGRKLVSAVFLTYRFDPEFFELEVLPAVFDLPLSHAKPVRLLQLEDALRDLRGHVAVYYDASGLTEGSGSAKLDVRRVPIRHRRGNFVFHPKNVLLLVEPAEPDANTEHPRALIVASLSANLTEAGWWRNVEACHIEEIAAGEKTRLKDDLAALLRRLKKARMDLNHEALDEVLAFLKGTEQRAHKSADGKLYTHLHGGDEPVADFLSRVAGDALAGLNLEVISPYFYEPEPLQALIEKFEPKHVRVYLPRAETGEVACPPALFESVRALPNVTWGKLPKDLLRAGKSEDVKERFVHAKVYRFFGANPKREILFVGSVNLTNAAHGAQNWETGFLVDREPARRPDFWLEPLEPEFAPSDFKVEREAGTAADRGTPLNVRYNWTDGTAAAFWDDAKQSPELHLFARNVPIGTENALPARAWKTLSDDTAKRLGASIAETSLVEVRTGDAVGWLLVQEEGMARKPSLLLQLSAADILRYWALLTADQRAAFVEARALLRPGLLDCEGAELIARAKIALDTDTVFDRFAGYFHAFGCMERAIRSALDAGHPREAEYRLFGEKYDSLGTLLDRVTAEGASGDDVDRYVLLRCARQLCTQIERDFGAFWKAHRTEARALEKGCTEALGAVRERLVAQNAADDFAAFLDWFDTWFAKRATPVPTEARA